MRRCKHLLALLMGLLLIIGGLSACSGTEGITGGEALGNFTTEDLEGNQVTQAIFSEKELTMVNIWGTFCSPCISEMPDLAALNQEYQEEGFQVVGIVIDIVDSSGQASAQGIATAQYIAEMTGAEYTHLIPSQDLINNKLKDVSAVPETIFVDENGVQVGETYQGARSKEAWQEIIQQLLNQQ